MSGVDDGSNCRSDRLLSTIKGAMSKDSGSEPTEGMSESTNEPVSERRREQIRRAQRLHRRRMAEHSQRVTAEIADLRAKDAAKTARIEHLEYTVAVLSNLLTQHGIAHEIPDPADRNSQAQVQIIENAIGQPLAQLLEVSVPGFPHVLGTIDSMASQPVDLADAQLGIDFILALEQPCLYHHHGPANNDDDLLGHSSQMQAPVMARAPALVTSADGISTYLPPASSWTVPIEELETLLSFSCQLRLPTEITPVQVWSRIRERGMGGWAPTKMELDSFLQALKSIVSCEGFGAVVDKAAFEQILDQFAQSA